ncbi:MAG: ribulokinase [Brevefilum sp.]
MTGKRNFTIGIDFGTETVQAVLVDVKNGKLAAASVYKYAHGVITDKLPETDIALDPGWALQDPRDYINALKRTVPKIMTESQISPEQVIGIGIDFPGSTLIPTTADGTPLSLIEDFKDNPHAWPKHIKHNGAHEMAERLTKIASDRFETFLDRYGGKINPEWLFPKVWEMYDDDSTLYNNAARLIEAADWMVWQLTGVETRNVCAAGFKALWSKVEGFPLETFFNAMDPDLRHVVEEKMKHNITPLGQQVGELTETAAKWLKLLPGTPVATALLNNHAAVPAATIAEPGKMALILGSRFTHMVLSTKDYRVPGMCGKVEDGIIPGLIAYQAGQEGSGDHFAWYLENAVPAEYEREARKQKISLFKLLEDRAGALQPAESGLVALDWWNGNRSILVDRDLSGLILGFNLKTKPEEIYRTLLEATIFGTRKIFETFIASGVPINEIIVTGGEPVKNNLLLNILANVTSMEIKVADAPHASALGSAIYAAVAAGEHRGGYNTIQDATLKMSRLRTKTYIPNNNDKKTYNRLYTEYTMLHDYFGYGHNNAMKRLKNLRDGILEKKRR